MPDVRMCARACMRGAAGCSTGTRPKIARTRLRGTCAEPGPADRHPRTKRWPAVPCASAKSRTRPAASKKPPRPRPGVSTGAKEGIHPCGTSGTRIQLHHRCGKGRTTAPVGSSGGSGASFVFKACSRCSQRRIMSTAWLLAPHSELCRSQRLVKTEVRYRPSTLAYGLDSRAAD